MAFIKLGNSHILANNKTEHWDLSLYVNASTFKTRLPISQNTLYHK